LTPNLTRRGITRLCEQLHAAAARAAAAAGCRVVQLGERATRPLKI